MRSQVEAVTRMAFPCRKCNSATFGKPRGGSRSAPVKNARKSDRVTFSQSCVCISPSVKLVTYM